MNTLSHSRRLRQQIEWVLPELTAATGAIVLHPQVRELYPEFMITVHQMVRATVPLMRTALHRCRELEANDTVAAAMVSYFEQHIKEEMHHDEWLLEDLELIGVPRAEVWRRMPSSAVASMIGGHYYWIHHHHPVAKLGQIAVQEGYPPSVETIDFLVERTGYPRAAFRTLEKHCHLDTHHRDNFNDALDRLPLTEEHHAVLRVSALHTARMATRAYREVLERATIPARRHELLAERVGDNGTFHLEDPDRGTAYELGEQEHFLLTQCDGVQSPEEVCRAFSVRFGKELTHPELDEFLDLARAENLLAEQGN
jgi:hypothetical protein